MLKEKIRYWKWVKGRQEETEYYKLAVYSFRIWKFGFDCYLLKYLPNTTLDKHTDKVDGKHFRINIPLRGSADFNWLGGDSLFGSNTMWLHTKGPVYFRPDKHEHFLVVSDKGALRLSFGFALLK